MRYLPLIMTVLIANWFFGLRIGDESSKRKYQKLWMILAVCFNIGILVFYKYIGFLMGIFGLSEFAPQISMPLGISFYTFQITSYVIDVYRKKIPVERNMINVMTFIILFPQLIAGPIVLYSDVRREMQGRKIKLEDLEKGMTVFIVGLASKVLLANPLGALFEDIMSRTTASAPAIWLATGASVFQLYFDFAGYSSMAIGMGHMMGFQFPQNFNHPLSARSMRDFWRRWHMTLGTWLRDYVYIPLGGSKGKPGRTTLNLLIVWTLSGLWHGADWNHLFWGLWFFLFVALERGKFGNWIQRHRGLGLFYTQLVFFFSLPLFSYSKVQQALDHYERMFSAGFGTDILYLLRGNGILILIACIFCAPSVFNFLGKVFHQRPILRVLSMSVLLLLCIAALVNEAYNPFIYFRF